MLVKRIGSKKKPILPINLPDTVGMDILSISLDVFMSGFKSSLVILNFLGKKTRKVRILANSDAILIKIRPITE